MEKHFRTYIIELERKLPVPDVFGCLHQSKMRLVFHHQQNFDVSYLVVPWLHQSS